MCHESVMKIVADLGVTCHTKLDMRERERESNFIELCSPFQDNMRKCTRGGFH